MFNAGKIDMQGKFVALVGALVFSTACIGAAVGPARAAETAAVVQVEAPASARV